MAPVTIIVNESSGSAGAKARELDAALSKAGLRANTVRVRGPEIAGAAEHAAGLGHTIVAAGGDGTVSTVAAVAVKTRATFGVLPLGTLNHFARDAGIPLDLDEAAAVVAEGHTQALDVSTLNDATFVNNASLGVYPHLVWERQREQSRGRGKLSASLIALWRTWRRYPTVAVHMMVDDASLIRRTPFVFIGNGEYRSEGLGLGTRASLNSGTLCIYLAPGVSQIEFLGLPFAALRGRLSADVKFEAFTACELTIETAGDHVECALDGELRSERAPLRCSIRRGALRTLIGQGSGLGSRGSAPGRIR